MIREFKNIQTGKIEVLNSIIEGSVPSETRFIWLAPHSGLYIPSYMIDLLSKDEKVFDEMFEDGDPFTNRFDFTDIGGQGIHTKIHRDVSDANRAINDETFIRKYSFGGVPIVKDMDKNTKNALESLSLSYWDEISKQINNFKKENPNKQLYLISIHSMDPLAKKYADGKLGERPGIGVIMENYSGKEQNSFFNSFRDSMKKYDVKLNNPYTKGGYISRRFREEGVLPVTIEINKDLFMINKEIHYNKFKGLEDNIREALKKIIN